MKSIHYKGKKIVTEEFPQLPESKIQEMRDEYNLMPDKETVLSELKALRAGGSKTQNITKYYVQELMHQVTLWHAKWSVQDVFDNPELLAFFYNKTKLNDKIFQDHESDMRKVQTAIRLGGKGVASKPTGFPIPVMREILQKYMSDGGKYYDFSCGWGTRMLEALNQNIHYHGTDPNDRLVPKLKEMYEDYKYINKDMFRKHKADIRCQGSEHFIEEWENTIDFAFSSIPYFGLEDYKFGDQSYKEGVTYKEWLDNYLLPTMENIYKYLKPGCKAVVNIKDYNGYTLEYDTKRMAKKAGLVYEGNDTMFNQARVTSKSEFMDNSERMFIFYKQ